MNLVSEEIVGAFSGSVASLPPMRTRSHGSSGRGFESHPSWRGQATRSFEAGETNRLNQAHWRDASDTDINCWLREKLPILRARSTYESRNNGMLAGVSGTLVDDVVGPDGPMLEVQSTNPAYNKALEKVWRDWFKAPTFRPNVSGAALLKLWIRNLPRCGEYLSIIGTDENADGPVQMRIRPVHPRRLESPPGQVANSRMIMGIEHDSNDRPARYWISETDSSGYSTEHIPYSPDDVIHEFTLDEEGQARGFPWFTPTLPVAAELREFDADVLDSSRRNAKGNGMLYTNSPDAPIWTMAETTTMEPGVIQMAPPQWKPDWAPPGQPAAQYPEFRAERQRELGRPINMPLMMVRLDSSRHNYSAARFDSQGWYRTVEGLQCWLAGTPESYGTLNRLLDLVAAEARFSVPELRNRPDEVTYKWTFQPRKHVDVTKEADGEAISLEANTTDLIEVLAERGTTIERHCESVKRAIAAYDAAGIPKPAWMDGAPQANTPEGRNARAMQAANEQQQQEPVSV